MATYSVNNSLKSIIDPINQSKINKPFMDVGVHENVKLTNVEYSLSKNSNEYISFSFENENGEVLTFTEWHPKGDDIERKVENQMRRVYKIVTQFIDESKYNFIVNSFKDFCEKTIQLLGDSYKNKLIRIKVVYDDNGFTTLPKYTKKFEWIESMSIPSDKSKIKMLSIDKTERPKIEKNNGNINPNDLMVSTENSFLDNKQSDKDDLPF